MMAKKSKQKHRPSEATPRSLSTEDLIRKAQDDLSRQNYRCAKEWFRELYRRDPETYRTPLAECYTSLANQLIKKDQLAEARTILEQVDKLSGGTGNPFPAALLAMAAGRFPDAARLLIRNRDVSNRPLPPEEEYATADALVLTFEEIPELPEKHPELARQRMAIHTALEQLCREHYAEASATLKPVGLQSIFSGWKRFIKGLCAFYASQDRKALEAFLRLPQESLLPSMARPYLYLLDETARVCNRGESKEPLLHLILSVLNRNDLRSVLPKAEYLWQTGRHRDSYEHITKNLPEFPTEKPGLAQALTQFYFNAANTMSEDAGERYLLGITKLTLYNPGYDSPNMMHCLRARNLFLDDAPEFEDSHLKSFWEEYLTLHEKLRGKNDRLAALIYRHLGNLLSGLRIMDPYERLIRQPGKNGRVRNAKMADEAYQESLKRDPGSRDTWLGLLQLYEKTGNNSRANRLLDNMIRRFPEDKEVLVKTGLNCINRKAFIKGLSYLEKAFRLDALDPLLKEHLCLSYVRAARSFAKKLEPRKYRDFLEKAIGVETARPDSFNTGRAWLLARWAAIESLAGFAEEGRQRLKEALQSETSPARLFYFSYLTGIVYGVPDVHDPSLETRIREIFKSPDAATAASLVGVFQYSEQIDSEGFRLIREQNRLISYVKKAATGNCTAEDAETIIRYGFHQSGDGLKLRKLYIQKILKENPENPLFLYFQFQDDRLRRFPGSSPSRRDLSNLKDILNLAMAGNNQGLVQTLQQEIRRIEEELSRPYWDNDDWNDEEDDENGLPDIPIDVLKALFDNLHKGKKSSPASRKRDKSPGKSGSTQNDDQMDFFNDL